MPRRNMTPLALVLALAPLMTMAETLQVHIEQGLTAEQLHATGLDLLSPAQLEALNQLFSERSGVGRDAASHAEDGLSHAGSIGLDDKPIRSRLKGSVSGWETGTVFELENGQRWKVLKGSMKLRQTLLAPEVVVVPGIAGRWFLQVDEDVPKPRVYRIQ